MERGLLILLLEPMTLFLCIYYVAHETNTKFSELFIWQAVVGIIAELISLVPMLILKPPEDEFSLAGVLMILFYLGTHITFMQFVLERFGVIERGQKVIILTIYYVSRLLILIVFFSFTKRMIVW